MRTMGVMTMEATEKKQRTRPSHGRHHPALQPEGGATGKEMRDKKKGGGRLETTTSTGMLASQATALRQARKAQARENWQTGTSEGRRVGYFAGEGRRSNTNEGGGDERSRQQWQTATAIDVDDDDERRLYRGGGRRGSVNGSACSWSQPWRYGCPLRTASVRGTSLSRAES